MGTLLILNIPSFQVFFKISNLVYHMPAFSYKLQFQLKFSSYWKQRMSWLSSIFRLFSTYFRSMFSFYAFRKHCKKISTFLMFPSKGALAWKALLKGKCFGKDYFLVNQSAEIMYMYRTTNHWSNRTENWVSNIKDVYQKKENHPPREKGKGIKLRRIQSIEKELWSVTKTTKKKQKVLLNLQNHQAEPLNQKTYQFNNISMKFESEKLCCLNNAKIIKLAALISPSTSEIEKSLSLMNLIFAKLTNLTHCMRIRNYLELLTQEDSKKSYNRGKKWAKQRQMQERLQYI